VSGYDSGFFKDEITDPKAWLETQLSGVTDGITGSPFAVRSFAHNYDFSSAGSRTASRLAGFTNGRGQINNVSQNNICSIDLYNIADFQIWSVTDEDEATLRTIARTWAVQASQFGWIMVFLNHTAIEMSTTQWGYVLDEWSKFPDLEVITQGELADIISSTWTDAGSGAYTNNCAFGNLVPQSGSTLINAGTPITGLHTSGSSVITGGDASGQTWLYGNGIDIGAYEMWQGQYQQFFEFMQHVPKLYVVP